MPAMKVSIRKYNNHILYRMNTKQIAGAKIYDEAGNEIPEVKSNQDRLRRRQYEPLIAGLIAVYNRKPSGRAPELDADATEFLHKITNQIKNVMDENKLSFDEDRYNKFVIEMCKNMYHIVDKEPKSMRGGVRGHHRSMSPRPSIERPRSSHRDDSTSSWGQHCMMMILMMSSLFMLYVAYIKFHQTLATVTSTGTVGEINDIINEIIRATQQLENVGFLQYIIQIFTRPNTDIDTYYTSQLTDMITTVSKRAVAAAGKQIKTTCGGDDIFTPGTLSLPGGLDLTNIVNIVSNSVMGMLNSGQTTECITNTVRALTREQFHAIETTLTLTVNKILMNKTIIGWYLKAASVLGTPAIGFYVRFFGRKVLRVLRSRVAPVVEPEGEYQEEANAEESPSGRRELLALPPPPPPSGSGGKPRSRRYRRERSISSKNKSRRVGRASSSHNRRK